MKLARLCIASLLVFASVAVAQTSAPATKTVGQPADVAAPKNVGKQESQDRFMKMHKEFVERAKQGNVDLLFLGDSITEGWLGRGKETWKIYEPMHVANFGISGDKTQHVLWRIENGEFDGIKPKVVVLMIGTNNIGSNPVPQIAKGVEEIVQTVRDKTGAKVLLLGVFPRGHSPATSAKQREAVAQINEIISKLDDGKNVRYLDIGDKFLQPDKTISADIMADYLHPTAKGYVIWADAMGPLLKEMIGDK